MRTIGRCVHLCLYIHTYFTQYRRVIPPETRGPAAAHDRYTTNKTILLRNYPRSKLTKILWPAGDVVAADEAALTNNARLATD